MKRAILIVVGLIAVMAVAMAQQSGPTNIARWANGVLGAMANYGTSPGAVLVPGMNAFVTNANSNGQATMANSSPVVIASNQSNVPVTPQLQTTGGWTTFLLAAQSSPVTTVKGSAGQLAELYCYNPNASVAYIQVFDVSGAVTVGTTTPAKSYGIPATSNGGKTLSVIGDQFANAIKVAATTTAKGSTAPTTAIDCTASYN